VAPRRALNELKLGGLIDKKKIDLGKFIKFEKKVGCDMVGNW
jgi:hypothetical protein